MTGAVRLIAAALALAGAALVPAAGAAGASPRTCTWGGTPLAATGQNRIFPHGLTSLPSTSPLRFHATGALGGQCRGTMIFDGVMDAGSSCSYITFHADVSGLPGVARVEGTSVSGFAPARLYDRRRQLVGSENAQFLSDPSVVSGCTSPQGVTHNPFSSVLGLFGS